MHITDITPNTGILILIDLEGYASFYTKEQLDKLIKDGSIQKGFYLIKADIDSVYQARESVELQNIHFKD